MKKPEHLFNWNDNDKKILYINDIEWNVENRFWNRLKTRFISNVELYIRTIKKENGPEWSINETWKRYLFTFKNFFIKKEKGYFKTCHLAFADTYLHDAILSIVCQWLSPKSPGVVINTLKYRSLAKVWQW